MDDVSVLDPAAWQTGMEMFNGWNSPWCTLVDQAKFDRHVDRELAVWKMQEERAATQRTALVAHRAAAPVRADVETERIGEGVPAIERAADQPEGVEVLASDLAADELLIPSIHDRV